MELMKLRTTQNINESELPTIEENVTVGVGLLITGEVNESNSSRMFNYNDKTMNNISNTGYVHRSKLSGINCIGNL